MCQLHQIIKVNYLRLLQSIQYSISQPLLHQLHQLLRRNRISKVIHHQKLTTTSTLLTNILSLIRLLLKLLSLPTTIPTLLNFTTRLRTKIPFVLTTTPKQGAQLQFPMSLLQQQIHTVHTQIQIHLLTIVLDVT